MSKTIPFIVRPIAGDEIAELIVMCAEHASYEGAEYDSSNKARELEKAIFHRPARLHVWVATQQDLLIGYASATSEYSTWSAREFLHMDCLFVREGFRGARAGSALLNAITDFAHVNGFLQIQWQTPSWNTDAARFYQRESAIASSKLRFIRTIAQS